MNEELMPVQEYEQKINNCEPNYEEKIAQIVEFLKAAGATIKKISVPEEVLHTYDLNLRYEATSHDPYNVIIIDGMELWRLVDVLYDYKRRIINRQKEQLAAINTKELLNKLGI